MAAGDAACAHDDRRAAGTLTALGVDAERAEAVEQRLDRTLAHRRRAVDHEGAASERDGRRQEARGGPGVADLQGGFGGREAPIDPIDDERLRGFVGPHAHAQRLEGLVHVARIVREERARDLGAPAGERGDQQGPIRVALRSGQLDHGVERPRDRRDGQCHVGSSVRPVYTSVARRLPPGLVGAPLNDGDAMIARCDRRSRPA